VNDYSVPRDLARPGQAVGVGCGDRRAAVYRVRVQAGRGVSARLIVRRIRDLRPKPAEGQGELFPAWRYHALFTDSPFILAQGELFPAWRYHALFTDSPFILAQAEAQHRGHALVRAGLRRPVRRAARAPAGSFPVDAAWLACTAISHSPAWLTASSGQTSGQTSWTKRRSLPDHPDMQRSLIQCCLKKKTDR
jgi:formate-dependent nitrite reductase cytochrome c552 subunit